MKRLILTTGALTLLFLSSCTMILVNDGRGGHSPMQIVNGQWRCDKNTITDANTVTDNPTNVVNVWFNATADVGAFCEGTWYMTTSPESEFLWSIDGEGTEFIIKENPTNETFWTILHLDQCLFTISRVEDDVVYEMEFSRDD
ncbi:MAG: hypothetical protein IIA45_07920 [Bacteroidetes bacterium]|nr:hypothetical protein [Bacteroidota bacterium]